MHHSHGGGGGGGCVHHSRFVSSVVLVPTLNYQERLLYIYTKYFGGLKAGQKIPQNVF
jgi:hypothetical protein